MIFWKKLHQRLRLPQPIVRISYDLKHIKSSLLLLQLRFRSLNGKRKVPIDDDTWFELQFRPQEALKYLGIRLPALPSDEVQKRFTAHCGRNNLQQAFSFYKYIRSTCKLTTINEPKILDFGGGWGRISRFFLRDTKPEFIWIADCLADSIHWLHATVNPCNIVKNNPRPPISSLNASHFDLIYCFSVFSHLNENYFNEWLTYLMDKLRSGGHLVFTTRGSHFIQQLERLHEEKRPSHLVEKLPHPAKIYSLYSKGEFQFYTTGGGGELESSFYGEALIPRGYIENRYGSVLTSFTEKVEDVGQAIIVLRKELD